MPEPKAWAIDMDGETCERI